MALENKLGIADSAELASYYYEGYNTFKSEDL